MTCFGPWIRIWTYTKDSDFLMPYYPEEGEGKSSYVDIAYDNRLLDMFDYMKKNVIPPPEGVISRQDTEEPSSSGINNEIIVNDSLTFVTVQSRGDDGSMVVVSSGGQRLRLQYDDWKEAQVYYDGRYHPCYAQQGRTTRKWFWAEAE